MPESVMEGAARIAAAVGQIPGVLAASLGGSAGAGLADAISDLDFHVFWEEPLAAPAERAAHLAAVGDAGSLRLGEGKASWTLEDHLDVGGRPIEVIYVRWSDVTGEVDHAYRVGQAEEAFSTARLHNVARGRVLRDPTGALGAVQARLDARYPEATRRAILRGHPDRLALYLGQARSARSRGDWPFVQHARVKVQLAWFDLLFALNRHYHPGEKRLLVHAARCPLVPAGSIDLWDRMARYPADDPRLMADLGALVAGLGDLVRRDGDGRADPPR